MFCDWAYCECGHFKHDEKCKHCKCNKSKNDSVFRVVFFDDQKTVLVEFFDDENKAKQRMNEYVGGYEVRLEVNDKSPNKSNNSNLH